MQHIESGPLFEPFILGDLHLPNRLVMSPMTRFRSPNGVPTAEVAQYYARRARGGIGLLITEGVYIPHPSAHAYADVPQFYGEAAMAGWRRVLEEVHAAGGRMFPQLWHTGAARLPGSAPDPSVPGFGPSELPGQPTKAMTDEDIAEVISAYARAAASAKDMGFDGVELHGAGQYLIAAFFWEDKNLRRDAWGGRDLRERAKFGVEIVKAIRAVVGETFPILFRWSYWGAWGDNSKILAKSPQDLELLLGALADAGTTAFDAGTRRFWDPIFPQHSNLSMAGWARKLTGKPAIAGGSVGLAGVATATARPDSRLAGGGFGWEGSAPSDAAQIDLIADMLRRGEVDMIYIGRALMADPDWAHKVRQGAYDRRLAFEPAHYDALF